MLFEILEDSLLKERELCAAWTDLVCQTQIQIAIHRAPI